MIAADSTEPDAPPNASAIRSAAAFLDAAECRGLSPIETSVDVLGGLGLHYEGPADAGLSAWAAFMNSGAATVVVTGPSGVVLASFEVCPRDPSPGARKLAYLLRVPGAA